MNQNKRVLIVEDEQVIANLIKINLMDEGFAVELVPNAEAAILQLKENNYSLCLLDWMLPGMQGIELLKKIRAEKSNLKILMLTAKADPDSIVQAIEAGADDYLTKPFDAKVLLARVRNLARRLDYEAQLQQGRQAQAKPQDPVEVQLDGLVIHFSKYTLTLNESDLHLTPSEFKLLASLLKAQGQVLTREQLIALIQGDDVNVTGRTIDTHIFALRKKLGAWAEHIETIRGVGYRILISRQDRTESATDL